jgi:hypothetical protein
VGCLLIVSLAIVALYIAIDRSQDNAMRTRLGFLAERGGVGATYPEIDALMKGAFRPGMMRNDVINRLNSMFGCYELYPLDESTGQPKENWSYVLFPGSDCTCGEFHASDTNCYVTTYSFLFDRDILLVVSRSSS